MTQLKRPALGRGLTSLMSQMAPEDAAQRELPLGSLVPNRAQPRTHFDEEALAELAESLKQHGMVQPIVVRKVGEQFEIIAGERRWRAARKAGGSPPSSPMSSANRIPVPSRAGVTRNAKATCENVLKLSVESEAPSQ